MSIEKKRSLLRISRERVKNPNFNADFKTGSKEIAPPNIRVNNTESGMELPVNRITTTIKSEYLGKNLYPDYIGKYKDKPFIIVGCGSSVNYFTDLSKYYVIGVNDVERILTPDFLVVVNDFRTFMRGRWEYVRDSMSPVIFSHLDNPGPITRSAHLAKIKVGERNQARLDQFEFVDHTMNSPYMAAVIAYQLGASKIGMIGVDFTNDHFFTKSGTHKLSKHIRNIDSEYGVLRSNLEKKGVKVANLSPISQLESWPRMDLEAFDAL
jgi:hypothetical protein